MLKLVLSKAIAAIFWLASALSEGTQDSKNDEYMHAKPKSIVAIMVLLISFPAL